MRPTDEKVAVIEKIVLTLGERWGVSHHAEPFWEKPGSVISQRELGVGVKYMPGAFVVSHCSGTGEAE